MLKGMPKELARNKRSTKVCLSFPRARITRYSCSLHGETSCAQHSGTAESAGSRSTCKRKQNNDKINKEMIYTREARQRPTFHFAGCFIAGNATSRKCSSLMA